MKMLCINGSNALTLLTSGFYVEHIRANGYSPQKSHYQDY